MTQILAGLLSSQSRSDHGHATATAETLATRYFLAAAVLAAVLVARRQLGGIGGDGGDGGLLGGNGGLGGRGEDAISLPKITGTTANKNASDDASTATGGAGGRGGIGGRNIRNGGVGGRGGDATNTVTGPTTGLRPAQGGLGGFGGSINSSFGAGGNGGGGENGTGFGDIGGFGAPGVPVRVPLLWLGEPTAPTALQPHLNLWD